MAWDGSGNVTLTNGRFTGTNDIFQRIATAADEKVRADRFDSLVADLVATLQNCLTLDGQNALSGALNMGSRRITALADATARADALNYGQFLDGVARYVPGTQVGGTGDAITLMPAPAVTSAGVGLAFRFAAKAANTGAATLQVNSLNAIDLGKFDASGAVVALTAGDLKVGLLYEVWHNGTQFVVTGGGAIGTVRASGIDSGTETSGRLLAATGTGGAHWVNPTVPFTAAVASNIDITVANNFVGTGLTGWNLKTLIFVSLGDKDGGTTVTFGTPTLVLFVADLLAIPAAAAAGVNRDNTGDDRNALQYVLFDRDGTGTEVFNFGRTSDSDPELLFTTAHVASDAYPFRAVAL